jgi:hypothetical protein
MRHPGLGSGLAKQIGATKSTPHIGVGSEVGIPWIALFLTFLAFRASVRNGCARVRVSGQAMRMGPRKEPCHPKCENQRYCLHSVNNVRSIELAIAW